MSAPLLVLLAIGALVAGAAVYALVLRRWHMTLGSRPDEAASTLPGDELVAEPDLQATHSISIRASPAAVWPWLVQMGQGRGGFYSYDWLEQLLGCQIHNVDRIVPGLQRLGVGDAVSLHVKAPALTVFGLEPHRALWIAGGPA